MELIRLLGWQEIAVRLGSAVLIGALLGLNRELRGKAAGLRTNALVCLGAALFVLAAISLATTQQEHSDVAAVSRVIQGVVTGIGFLGAGVILRDTSGKRVHGLTTAAAIWLAAALGVLCGEGLWPVAAGGVVLTLFILVVCRPVEKFLHKKFPGLTEEDRDPRDHE